MFLGSVRWFFVGLIVGLLLYGGVQLVFQWQVERRILVQGLDFVEAEYQNNRSALLELATDPIDSDIREGRFPDLAFSDPQIMDARVVELCGNHATMTVKVLPEGDDRYHIEKKENGRWRVSAVARDR